MTRYFLDAEFYEDGKTIDLISIALVSDKGDELYLCNRDVRLDLVSDWVWRNVVKQLPSYSSKVWVRHNEIRDHVLRFVEHAPYKVEFWGWYADYDWVVFCQLFGTMMGLPKHFPKVCKDIKQLADDLGNPELPKQEAGAHDALCDARHQKMLYERLVAIRDGGGNHVPLDKIRDAMFCDHANEVPGRCPCDEYCYCRNVGSCKNRQVIGSDNVHPPPFNGGKLP